MNGSSRQEMERLSVVTLLPDGVWGPNRHNPRNGIDRNRITILRDSIQCSKNRTAPIGNRTGVTVFNLNSGQIPLEAGQVHPLPWKPHTHFGADSLTLTTTLQGKLKHSLYLKASQKRTGGGGQREAFTIIMEQVLWRSLILDHA